MKQKPQPCERVKRVLDYMSKFRHVRDVLRSGTTLPKIKQSHFVRGSLVMYFEDGTWTRLVPHFDKDFKGKQWNGFASDCPQFNHYMLGNDDKGSELVQDLMTLTGEIYYSDITAYREYMEALEGWKDEQRKIELAKDTLERLGVLDALVEERMAAVARGTHEE